MCIYIYVYLCARCWTWRSHCRAGGAGGRSRDAFAVLYSNIAPANDCFQHGCLVAASTGDADAVGDKLLWWSSSSSPAAVVVVAVFIGLSWL